MKIATYNIWYENIGVRKEQLVHEINNLEADIIGLQEVPPNFYEQYLTNTKYPYHSFHAYEEEMGLAFLSKYPLKNPFSLLHNVEFGNSIAVNAVFEDNGIVFSITNVHLPWDSVLAKEQQIVAIDKFIHTQKEKAHFFILLGDFNSTLASSVHRYLLGDQTLQGWEAKPYWNDLAGAHAALHGCEVTPTLDFVNNPRWRGNNTNYVPDTYDRIYIMESFDWNNEFKLYDVSIFGKEVSPKTGFAPSDHYGLLAEAGFTVGV